MRSQRFNPEHPVTKAMENNWHKIVALMMLKLGLKEMIFTEEEIDELAKTPSAVAIRMKTHSIELHLMSEEEGARLARKEGGNMDGYSRIKRG